MNRKKIILKITVNDLLEICENEDYDIEKEVEPNIKKLEKYVILNTDVDEICKLALSAVLGTPLSKRKMWNGNHDSKENI